MCLYDTELPITDTVAFCNEAAVWQPNQKGYTKFHRNFGMGSLTSRHSLERSRFVLSTG